MFDSNAMAERAALKRAHGGGRRKDGVNKVVGTKAYYDYFTRDLSAWELLVFKTRTHWQQTCQIQKEHYRLDCLTSQEGFRHGETIPF
jgi:hypothetical protein